MISKMAFEGFNRPTPLECRRACDLLAGLHGLPIKATAGEHGICELPGPHTVLDSLVRTILSQNTTDLTSQRAFTSLKTAFPDWEHVRTAPPGAVEATIRVGGLADIKTARIKAILEALISERGELSLEHLRTASGEHIKQQLSRFKGVGPKSIACVMMFCLDRAEFPVDTHVWEISKQLGWVPAKATREQTYQHLNGRVPDDIKYSLHVLMVQHGKVCPSCSKQGPKQRSNPKNVQCPLSPLKGSKTKTSGQLNDDNASGLASSRKKQKTVVAAAATAAAAAVPDFDVLPPDM